MPIFRSILSHLHRRVGIKCDCGWECGVLYLLPPRLSPSEELRLFSEPNIFPYNNPHSQQQSHFVLNRLWICNKHSVPKRWHLDSIRRWITHTYSPMKMEQRQSGPKRWHLNYRRRGITQKKAYDIQNRAKVWNHEKLRLSKGSLSIMTQLYIEISRPFSEMKYTVRSESRCALKKRCWIRL
jgi:hypothetical protein